MSLTRSPRWVALLATTLFSACAVELAEEPEVQLNPDAAGGGIAGSGSPDSAIEPVASALTNPQKFYGVKTTLSGSHVPSADFRTNVTEIVRVDTGRYMVILNTGLLDGIPFPNTAMVVAYGGGIARCKLLGWAATGPEAKYAAFVLCHNGNTGALTNSRFVFTAFTAGTTISGRTAGGFVGEDGSVSAPFSTGGAVGAQRTGEGEYNVILLGLATQVRGGTVQVTAQSPVTQEGLGDASHCKVVSWAPDPGPINGIVIRVKCFKGVSNDPGDSAFYFLYDEEIPARHNRGAYSWANNETSTVAYQPNRTYTFSRGPSVSDSSTSASASMFAGADEIGHYKMVYRGPSEADAKKSYAFVVAYGDGPEYCKLVSYDTVEGCTAGCDIEVQSQCYRQGQRKPSRYVQTWASANGLLVD